MNNIMIPSHLTAREQFQHYGAVTPDKVEPMLNAFEWVDEHVNDLECHMQDATDLLPGSGLFETLLDDLGDILANGADADQIRALIDKVNDLQCDLEKVCERVRSELEAAAGIIELGEF